MSGRLLERARAMPQLVQIKMADRLDNTLDLRIELTDPLDGVDFFQELFNVLFLPAADHERIFNHPRCTASLNDARRLYQLFKNAVLLSMIRQRDQACCDAGAQVVFDAICAASLKEAQRTMIHVATYLKSDRAQLRDLALDAMDYCHAGRISMATKPDRRHTLDGLFSSYFGADERAVRSQRLDELFGNKPLMVQASIAFIVIFTSFLGEPDFFVRGISKAGISPQ